MSTFSPLPAGAAPQPALLPAAVSGAEGSFGPVNPETGYPYWYGDQNGLRLELCLDDVNVCPVVGAGYDPSQPPAIPGNFPDESFWWSAEASLTLPNGQDARLIMAQEAAFGGAGEIINGQQAAFARMRIRLDDMTPNATYKATTPYGVYEVTADDRGRVRFTEDIGCLQQPCTWNEPLSGSWGPFLQWDSPVPAAYAGSIGDPNVEHTVTGSPFNTNFFRIEGPGIPAPVETNLFAVQGKIATVRAGVDKPGGTYNQALTVNIQASFPDEAKIVYTTDGTDPVVAEDGSVSHGEVWQPSLNDNDVAPVSLATPGTTELRYMAVSLTEPAQRTGIKSETYNLDATSPWIAATPDAAAPNYAGPQQVTLTGTTAEGAGPATVYYTLDGSEPTYDNGGATGSTKEYDGTPITVGSTTLIRAMSVNGEGAAGEIRNFRYVIHNLKAMGPVVPGGHGYPSWLEDHTGVQLDLCLDDPLCPIIEELPLPENDPSFPDNFPGESFWWAAEAFLPVEGEEVRLTLALEAAFSGEAVIAGDEVAFGRIRVRGDDVFEVGSTYQIIHPYGTFEVIADDTGSLRYTEDLGSMNGNGDFTPLLEQKVGPFLRWTEGAPEGYLGDGSTPHAVTGSPYNTNSFEIRHLKDPFGEPVNRSLGTTTDFVVQGRTVGATPPEAPTAAASTAGGTFNESQTVTLSATPEGAQIFFTMDGSEPTAEDGTPYTGEIALEEGTTTLKFIAVNGGVPSAVVTEVYTVDSIAPELTTTTPGGTFTAATTAVLSASEGAAIRFTTDGTDPTVSSPLYTEPIAITQTSTLRAIAVDGAGNISPLGQWEFVINVPAGLDRHDFSGDGNPDALARDTSGKLWLYPGDGAGKWLPRVYLGAGWNSMTSIVGPGDFNGDGKADVLARDGSGKLWLYPGNGAGKWLPRVYLGAGWNSMTSIVGPGDFNGDGNVDALARDGSGKLWLYPGNGAGKWLPRVYLGAGWNSMTSIVGPGDFNGDGNVDALARDGSGKLWLYPGNGAGKWLPRVYLGAGWNSMTSIL
ncbi:chitobiase/beta-hexosaminidase C-terminal domain-containing protein [Arthrobacter sp. ZGTC412]|uniref:chitobiase/beta-hexosaminidase C-terminal domain-containing protein n=1 Tax=Arthrobacter sp. ZGTC412 TaxID=2058900 RepID=UPI0015E31B59|nr:chitobiase/beta-hexosaminidase C-terminal domain-containing protein [Arthrobacter sp. ZGTC412]